MSKFYYIEDNKFYLSAAAPKMVIKWARTLCALEGYELIFFI